MDSQNLIRNTDGIPNTHYFVYRSKKYPIKYDFFKYSSNYFRQHHKEIKKTEDIRLLDEESEKIHELSDDTIINFINFIQCSDIKLTPENVVDLNYLSTVYEVPTLKKHTEDFISKNHQKVAVQLLQMLEKSDTLNPATYEEIISDSLNDYLHDGRLLSLEIPTLHRILRRYRLKESEQKTKKEVFDFVFKVFEKRGREASILFSEVDFGDARIECINRLLTEFSTEFDFHFINSSLLQSLYEANNQLILNDEKHRKEIDELNEKMKSEIQRIEKKCEDELNRQKEEMKDAIDQIRSELLGEIKRLQKEVGDNNNESDGKLKEEIKNREKNCGLIQKDLDAVKDEMKELKKFIELKQKEEIELKRKKEEEELKRKKKEENGIELLHKEDFKGIIDYLTHKTKGNIDDNKTIEVTSNSYISGYPPKNLLDFNCNNCYQAGCDDESWVCFDFKSMRIKITGYSVQFHTNGSHQFKSFILEVSNDNVNWITIDQHQNLPRLKGGDYKRSFDIKPNDFYRYVRLRQTEKPWDGHYLWYHYVEFYGYLKE